VTMWIEFISLGT